MRLPGLLNVLLDKGPRGPEGVRLACSGENVGPEQAAQLASALATSGVLIDALILSDNPLQSEGSAALCAALLANAQRSSFAETAVLTDLDLAGCLLGDAACAHIARLLHVTAGVGLRSLTVARNLIRASGASCLAQALATNATLRSLDLSSCCLGDTGAEVIAESLRSNWALESLSLRRNFIGRRGLSCLADALTEQNSTLLHLDVTANRPVASPSLELESIASQLDANRRLAGARNAARGPPPLRALAALSAVRAARQLRLPSGGGVLAVRTLENDRLLWSWLGTQDKACATHTPSQALRGPGGEDPVRKMRNPRSLGEGRLQRISFTCPEPEEGAEQ